MIDIKWTDENGELSRPIEIAIVGLFVFIVGISAILSDILHLGVIGTIQTISSGTLTLVLVFLYDQQRQIQKDQQDIIEEQTDIQSKQTGLMEQQTEWMSKSHKPRIMVDNWDLLNEDLGARIDLTNMGNGVAYNLALHLSIRSVDEEFSGSQKIGGGMEVSYPNDFDDDYVIDDLSQILERPDQMGHRKRVINPEEEYVIFENTQGFGIIWEVEEDEEAMIDPYNYFNNLREEGISEVRYRFYLQYEYGDQITVKKDLVGGLTEIEDVHTLLDLVRYTKVPNYAKNPIEPTIDGEDIEGFGIWE